MATLADIATVHRMTATTNADPVYTDLVVGTYIDNLGTNEAAAGAIWGEKAASAASLVDMSESGSSRSLSQIQKNALAMQKHFAPDPDQGGGDKTTYSFTVGIDRV